MSHSSSLTSKVILYVKVITCKFVKKETLAHVFACEFCEISKNTFLHRTPLVAASENEFVVFKFY